MLIALALMLSACQVDATVVVSVAENGGGTVTVEVAADVEAIERVGKDLANLELDDLETAGWSIEGPLTRDELVVYRAAKPFAGSAELGSVLAEVLGPDALSEFRLERDKRWGEVEYHLTGTVDLTEGLEVLSDSELTDALGGAPLGVDLEALEEELGQDPAQAVRFNLVVVMPGETSDGLLSEQRPVNVTFAVPDAAPVDLMTLEVDEGPRQWRLMSIGLAVIAGLTALVSIGGSIMNRRS